MKTGFTVERVKGIEPSYAAWEAAVLPLNYTRDCAEDFTLLRRHPQTRLIGSVWFSKRCIWVESTAFY